MPGVPTFIFELVRSLCRLALEVLGYVVNLGLVLEEDGADDPRVYLDGSVRRSWSHAPHQEGTLRGGETNKRTFSPNASRKRRQE